ncbi:MAG: 30S ribosomal protein S12 methylthiotransferase RimO, partial [Candidatus Latescibacter sp.]|nr:30S ribosomal protein S12 methylthiotransferase RimO [Candidatus Latescibacter sp.]
MSAPTAALVTLGCPMNQVDSERIMGGLVSLGFEIVPEEEADIIVVNTCGFIESAREESIETILSLADLKKKGRVKALVVAGCLAERYRNDLVSELSEADAIVGLSERDRIPALCLELAGRAHEGETLYTRVVSGPLHTAYLKISEGCNNLCAYCTIPMIRGPYGSLAEEDILREAEELVSVGARELVIIGQDTTNYGIDLDNGNLPSLLEKIAAVEGVEWLRLMYAHPSHVTEELITAFDSIPQLLPYLDLPVQHISPGILRRMGRLTPPDRIRALLENLRNRVESLVIRTSLIVGFPGETEEDFEELLDFMKEVRFERLGAFVYSPEEGTRAALLEDRVPEETAAERYEEVMSLQAEISGEFQESLVGIEMEMIVDEIDPETGDVFGRSYMDAPEVDGAISIAGDIPEGTEFCRVLITEAGTYDLIG